MAELRGFWSYVQRDDEADGGRIVKLARDVAAEFEMLTGDQIELFLDKDDLAWGDDWRNSVDAQLASIGFFVPAVTPRFFRSAECRRELQFFARRFSEEGTTRLLLPLLYIDVPGLQEGDGDDLFEIIRRFQWEDWRELRFVDPAAESYRRGVHALASRLVVANREAELASTEGRLVVAGKPSGDVLDDDEPGLIDRIAAAEVALPEWNESLSKISDYIEKIGDVFTAGHEEIQASDRAGKGFGGRAFVARKIARRLTEPVEELVKLTGDFTRHMHDVDSGLRAIIAQAPIEVEEEPELRDTMCTFYGVLRQMAAAARSGFASTREMAEHTKPMETASRDLRPVLRHMRQGLTAMAEAAAVINEWVRLADSSGIDCPNDEIAKVDA